MKALVCNTAATLALLTIGTLQGCTQTSQGANQVVWMGATLPAAAGDRLFRSYTTVEFQVVDAETEQPVAGALVHVGYGGWQGMKPDDIEGTTNAEGKTSLRIVRDRAPYAGATAAGYMPSPGRDGQLGNEPPAFWQLRVYRLPQPYHVLEVPPGARGRMRLRLLPVQWDRPEPRNWPNWRPGQRAFVTQLDPEHMVDMQPLPDMGATVNDLNRILAAHFADGRAVPLWIEGRYRFGPDVSTAQTPPVFSAQTYGLWEIGIYSHPIDVGGTLIVLYMGTLGDAAVAQKRLQQEWHGTLKEGLYILRELPIAQP